jgi:hypothetical protein
MIRIIVAGTVLLALGTGDALAQNCTIGNELGQAAIGVLLANRYACATISPTENWNELHSSGFMLDYKKGPTDKSDPSDTLSHPTGTYTLSGGNGIGPLAGVVTYTYGPTSYSYHIRANLGATTPNPGQYSFCTTGGGRNLAVTISASHC